MDSKDEEIEKLKLQLSHQKITTTIWIILFAIGFIMSMYFFWRLGNIFKP